MGGGITIRRAHADDLPALYEVCLRTGDAGQDATALHDHPTLLGEIYVGPYVVLPGCIALTAVDEGGPAGYCLAAVDTRDFEARCEADWWPALRARHPDPGPAPATPDEELAAHVHRPPVAPAEVVADFPAHLHIDLLPRLQGRGVGGRLLRRLLDELRARGVPGVHLGVDARNTRAIGFYRHLGFTELARSAGGVTMGLHLSARGAPGGGP